MGISGIESISLTDAGQLVSGLGQLATSAFAAWAAVKATKTAKTALSYDKASKVYDCHKKYFDLYLEQSNRSQAPTRHIAAEAQAAIRAIYQALRVAAPGAGEFGRLDHDLDALSRATATGIKPVGDRSGPTYMLQVLRQMSGLNLTDESTVANSTTHQEVTDIAAAIAASGASPWDLWKDRRFLKLLANLHAAWPSIVRSEESLANICIALERFEREVERDRKLLVEVQDTLGDALELNKMEPYLLSVHSQPIFLQLMRLYRGCEGLAALQIDSDSETFKVQLDDGYIHLLGACAVLELCTEVSNGLYKHSASA